MRVAVGFYKTRGAQVTRLVWSVYGTKVSFWGADYKFEIKINFKSDYKAIIKVHHSPFGANSTNLALILS